MEHRRPGAAGRTSAVSPICAALPTDRPLGAHTTVLTGDRAGTYPSGNSVLVAGRDGAALIDPSTAVTARGGAPGTVDLVVLTHTHEDHVAGMHLFGDAEVMIHRADHHGIASLDGLMEIYGMEPAVDAYFREVVVRDFTYTPRPDASTFDDGTVIDLGGVTITVVHLPGHTAGHCGLLIEPDGVFITGDIDLSGFGPYYGDATSSLDDFERSLSIARTIDARWYSTFHHKGVVHGRDAYVTAVDAFTAVIARRELAMVEFMTGAARTLAELVAHRFVYRPRVTLTLVDGVERRSAEMSLTRLVDRGIVREVEPGCYLAG